MGVLLYLLAQIRPALRLFYTITSQIVQHGDGRLDFGAVSSHGS